MKLRNNRFHQRLMSVSSRPVLVRHDLVLPNWDLPEISALVLADFHFVAPWTTLRAFHSLVPELNGLGADIVFLVGDFLAGATMPGIRHDARRIAGVLDGLNAPLGVHAVLGNHDWMDCALARRSGLRENSVRNALEESSVNLLQNASVMLPFGSRDLALVGFDSQRPKERDWSSGLHDPEKAFAGVGGDVPTILLAHEPDYFAAGDPRAQLQVSGHTHGGQINFAGWRPVVPSQFGARYAYGHYADGERHLVVTGGYGFSGIPLRLLQPPEVTLLRLRAE